MSAVEWGDAYIEANAQAYDSIFPGFGDVLRDLWRDVVRIIWTHALCDCDPKQYHRWNCRATPIWAQTIRDLDCNPWAVIENSLMPATADFATAQCRISKRPFQWIGDSERNCGRDICCLGDGHDGGCVT